MREYIDSISDGTGAILVRDISLKGNSSADFMKYLRNEGFKMWSKSKGSFDGVDWVYVNLNSKRYAYGMPGIPVTTPFGNHAENQIKTICRNGCWSFCTLQAAFTIAT